MAADDLSSDIIARFDQKPANPVWLLAGVAIVGGFILASRRGDGDPLPTLAMIGLLALGVGLVSTLAWLTQINAVELHASGSLDFVSRVRRDSYPRTALVRVEGRTARAPRGQRSSVRASSYYSACFTLAPAPGEQVEKKIRLVRHDDPKFQDFVRRLEGLNPRLDTAQYWTWSKRMANDQ